MEMSKTVESLGSGVNGFEGDSNYFIGDQPTLAIIQASWDPSKFGADLIGNLLAQFAMFV